MTKWEREIIFRTIETKGQMAIAPQEDTIKFRQVRTDKGEEWAEWNAIENLWGEGIGGIWGISWERKFEGMTYKPIELRPLGGRAERKEDNAGCAGKLDRQGNPSLKASLSQV